MDSFVEGSARCSAHATNACAPVTTAVQQACQEKDIARSARLLAARNLQWLTAVLQWPG
jgi:hypothetical protein